MEHLNGWIDVKFLIMDLLFSTPPKFPMEENSIYCSEKERHLSTYPFKGMHFFLMNFEDVSLPLASSGFTKDSETLESLQANLERHGEDSDPDPCAMAAEPTGNVPLLMLPACDVYN